MCLAGLFGGRSKSPSLPPPPPIPSPPPTPIASESGTAGDDLRKRRSRLRRGLLSTIKTSPTGIFKTGPQLTGANATGAGTLG